MGCAANRPRRSGTSGTFKTGNDADMESPAQLSGLLVASSWRKALELPENGAGVLLKDQTRRSKQNAFAAALE